MKRYVRSREETTKEKPSYVLYAHGTMDDDGNAMFWSKRGGGKYTSIDKADRFTLAEANRLSKMDGKYRWVKERV